MTALARRSSKHTVKLLPRESVLLSLTQVQRHTYDRLIVHESLAAGFAKLPDAFFGDRDAETILFRLLASSWSPRAALVDLWVIDYGMVGALDRVLASQELRLDLNHSTLMTTLTRGPATHFDRVELVRLREHLAAAPLEVWTAARDFAASRRTTPWLRATIAGLFPDEPAWADEELEGGVHDEQLAWVVSAVSDPELAADAVRKHGWKALSLVPSYFPSVDVGLATAYASFGARVLPVIAAAYCHAMQKSDYKLAASILGEVRSDAALDLLCAAAADKLGLAELTRVGAEEPQRVIAAIERARDQGPLMPLKGRLQRALGQHAAEASPSDMPEWLVSPPWLAKKKKAKPAQIAVQPRYAPSISWANGERERLQQHIRPWHNQPTKNARQSSLSQLSIDPSCADLRADDPRWIAAVAAGLEKHTAKPYGSYVSYRVLADLDDPDLALSIVQAYAKLQWWVASDELNALLAARELKALPALITWATYHPQEGLEILMRVDAAEIAPIGAHLFSLKGEARLVGKRWLLAHPKASVHGLLPAALGNKGQARDEAERVLRVFAGAGHRELILAIAQEYGDDVATAIRAMLDFDPIEIAPSRIPSLGSLWSPAAVARPCVKATGALLTLQALEHVGQLLAMSKLDARHEGLHRLKRDCTAESLAAFAWDLFDAWMLAGAPAKSQWAMYAVGWLGDDDCARKLTALLRVWPTEGASARAATALQVLAEMGSTVALMQIHGVAQKVKSRPLQQKARDMLQRIAESREMSTEELADYLVPDMGLDADGTTVLDFGPRKFVLGFDRALKPRVKDGTGAWHGDLPKPRQDDDPALAQAAHKRWKALKKDSKAIVSLQLARLEGAMCTRRRWPAATFRTCFVEHPFMRHLAQRLVFGVFAGPGLQAAFRVCEDLSFANERDEAFVLQDDATVGLLHGADFTNELARAFSTIFGDYEIVQPFAQINRPVKAALDEERKNNAFRFVGKSLPTTKVLSLERKGWRRGPAEDGGMSDMLERRLGERVIRMTISPGLFAGNPLTEKEQEIEDIEIGEPLDKADPILLSEVICDVGGLFD